MRSEMLMDEDGHPVLIIVLERAYRRQAWLVAWQREYSTHGMLRRLLKCPQTSDNEANSFSFFFRSPD